MPPNIPNELAALLATGFLRARRRGVLEITEAGLEVPPESRLSGTNVVNTPETRRGEHECR